MTGVEINLERKNALVAGGATGLGPFICQALDAAGANVAVHYNKNQNNADNVVKSLSNRSKAFKSDFTKVSSVRKLMRDVKNHYGFITILVNCAATESRDLCHINKISSDRWERTQRTNVVAPFILTQEFAKQKIGGSIVNISSIEGGRPSIGRSHYSVSKAALEMLTKSSALEYGSLGVRVNAVAPGLISRENIDKSWPEGVAAWKKNAPLGVLVKPEDLANAVVFLASDKASSISGAVLTIDCGLTITSGW